MSHTTLPCALRTSLTLMSSALIGVALACVTDPAAAAQPAQAGNDHAPGRILVEARAGLSTDELDKILKGHNGKGRKIGQSNLFIVDLPPGLEKQAAEKLARHPLLKFAELDRRVKAGYAPNDPYFGSAWHLSKVGAASAWDKAQGAGVTIAVLDSGVDGAHPDLAANMVAGYNHHGNNTDTSDACGHGTAVAGVAAGILGNGAGVAGIAGRAQIMPMRVAYYDAGYGGCYTYFSTVASGLTWAADRGARIANVSYAGVAGSSSVQSAANYLKNKGGLTFVSAGNASRDEGYAPSTALVAVSATDNNDAKASWSSWGNFVSLSAPGTGLWSTNRGGGYGTWNGTSFASPLAAGVAALMMSAAPSLSAARIEQLLFSTAVDLGSAGRDSTFGYGRVNAAAAVQAAVDAAGSAPVADTQAPTAAITSPGANATVSGLVAVNANAADNVGVAQVALLVNGSQVAIDTSAPYGFSWDTRGSANGMATLTVRATDAAGNATVSSPVAVNVANAVTVPVADTIAPVVKINNPVAGYVSGNVTVSVSATDNSGAAGIRHSLYIDGALRAQGSGASLAYTWNTRKIARGTHTVQAVATDAAGNRSTATVQVTRK